MFQRISRTAGFLPTLALFMIAPYCSAAIGPVTSITTDNPPGSPPYNILSITAGGYTAMANRLATGTTTYGSTEGTPCPENDDFDINTALNYNLGQGPYFTVLFGGKLWKDSNGDAPDFFLFNSGGDAGDDPEMQAVFPDGSLGQMVKIPPDWQDLGYSRVAAVANDAVDMDGQSLEGMSWAITDMLDAGGNPLTNDTVIMGYQFARSGTDPVGFFAVAPPVVRASEPSPADEANDVPRETVLDWTPAESASAHDVYFGEILTDVNEATRTDPRGVLVAENQAADTFSLPKRLKFDKTYYWRVDEIDAATGEIHKGEVWVFITEPFSYALENVMVAASSSTGTQMGPEKTVDRSGLSEDDLHSTDPDAMWLSGADPNGPWIEYAFDKVYKLHEMWVWNSNQMMESIPGFGFGIKEVTVEHSIDGVDWTVVEGVEEFAQAPGVEGYAHETVVDFNGVSAQFVRITAVSSWGGQVQAGLSEVRFFTLPVRAREPQPRSGATEVNPDVVLSWRAGREAALHDVYLGTDMNDLPLVDTVHQNTYDPEALDLKLSARYFWKIDEVNDAEAPVSWEGDTWEFSTATFLVVDDFEGYTNESPNRVFQTWIDGVGFSADEFFPAKEPGNATGASLGHDIWKPTSPHYQKTIMEQTIVHGGRQSAPLYYSGVSEIDRTFGVPQDWTRAGVATLVLHFYGDPGNAPGGQIDVKINGVKVPYDGFAGALARPWWTQWNIDLASVAVNLQSVTTLTVGVEDGGSGLVYLDDILLYREAPVAAREEVWIEAEAADTLGSLWTTADDGTASAEQYLGSEDGDGDDNNDPPEADWHATYNFVVAGGTYKLVARIITSPGNSFWVRIADATSPQITREDGWINTNPMDAGDTWHWDEIHNDQQNDNVVHFTLSAGQHTLELTKREDGTLLDAIVITDKLE